MPTIDIDRVAGIVREVAEVEIMPRWRNLAAGDVSRKSHKGDLVTVADHAAEVALSRRLLALLPGSVVIGEEAVHADSGLLQMFRGSDPVWVIDPIDGTRAFTEGRPTFDVLVALVTEGVPVAGWIYAPAERDLYLGDAGGGVFRETEAGDRTRLATRHSRPIGDLSGIVNPQFYLNRKLPDPAPALAKFRSTTKHTCAGHNYARLLRGDSDFLINFSTLPWDHLPGLALTAAAGFFGARHDSRPFDPLDPQGGILVAPDRDAWEAIHELLVPRGQTGATSR